MAEWEEAIDLTGEAEAAAREGRSDDFQALLQLAHELDAALELITMFADDETVPSRLRCMCNGMIRRLEEIRRVHPALCREPEPEPSVDGVLCLVEAARSKATARQR